MLEISLPELGVLNCAPLRSLVCVLTWPSLYMQSSLCMYINRLQIRMQKESFMIISSGLQPEMFVCTEYLFSSVCLHVHVSSSPSIVALSKHKFRLPHIFLSTHLTLNISFFLGKMDLNSLICQILLVRQQASSMMCACLHLHENNLLLLRILGRKAVE